MECVAPDVWLLTGTPQYAVNQYLIGDVLVDTGTRWDGRRLMRVLRRRSCRMVALTHCHPDHRGSAAMICRTLRLPLACHEADAPIMDGRQRMPLPPLLSVLLPAIDGGQYPVGRILQDGDLVAGFRVVHAPGHTMGHVFFHRDSDGVVIAGDVLANIHLITGRVGLLEPPRLFSVDPALNRDSARRLLKLRPSLVCFGHGPPLRDITQLEKLVARLPDYVAPNP
jgi:glyoxylase-like metal-dependent hydrolase (beta-lactamase superfamily II)